MTAVTHTGGSDMAFSIDKDRPVAEGTDGTLVRISGYLPSPSQDCPWSEVWLQFGDGSGQRTCVFRDTTAEPANYADLLRQVHQKAQFFLESGELTAREILREIAETLAAALK